jgi:hypothetical protein
MAVVTLAQLQAEILDSVDMTGSGPSSTQFARKINRSLSELYDLLVMQHEHYFIERCTLTTDPACDYVYLPDGFTPVGSPPCYKLLNAYYPFDGREYELRRMNHQEYKLLADQFTPIVFGQNLSFILLGNQMVFQGFPGDSFELTLWYVPQCPQLQTLLLSNGDNLSQSTWTKLDTARDVVTAYAAANPLTGQTNACSVTSYTTNAQHGVTQAATLTAASYNLSVYAKKGASAYDWLYLGDNTSGASCYFDLDAGVKGTASGCIGIITDVDGGWYRCSITVTGTAASHTFQIGPAQADADKVFAGSGSTVDCYLYGAQLVQDTQPQAYSTVTDSVDWAVPFGWTAYIVNDVCAQLMAREESDPTPWLARKEEAKKLIVDAALKRDLGKAGRITRTWRTGHRMWWRGR